MAQVIALVQQQRPQLCAFLALMCELYTRTRLRMYHLQAVSALSTVSPGCCSACIALGVERTAL